MANSKKNKKSKEPSSGGSSSSKIKNAKNIQEAQNVQRKMQELQILEQNLQNTLMQKQAFQMELSETKSAMKEVEKSGDEVYKIIGQLMIKSDKNKIKEELENKEKILDLRMKSLEKQENSLKEKLDELRNEVMK